MNPKHTAERIWKEENRQFKSNAAVSAALVLGRNEFFFWRQYANNEGIPTEFQTYWIEFKKKRAILPNPNVAGQPR